MGELPCTGRTTTARGVAERAGEEGVREDRASREGGEDEFPPVVDVEPLMREVGDGACGRAAGAGAEFGVARGQEYRWDGEEGDREDAACCLFFVCR